MYGTTVSNIRSEIHRFVDQSKVRCSKMATLRLIAVALASIVALSNLETVHGRRANTRTIEEDEPASNKATASRRARTEAAALALKDAVSSVVPAADNSNTEEEEKLEKIGEDIALLKLDDKIYWNRFLQNSGSAGAAPSAAPTVEDGDDDDDDDDDGELKTEDSRDNDEKVLARI